MTPSKSYVASLADEGLYVAAVCDVLDTLGYRNQAMHPRLRPQNADPATCGFAGRARTLRWMATDHVDDDDPYGLEIEAIDSILHGDVVVHSTDHAGTSAPWGELMAGVAKRNGAVGCVCDANIRDCRKILEIGLPVYHRGIYPVDSKGRSIVKAFDVPVRCGEVLVHPGDIVFADFDGIVVIPQSIEAQVLELAAEKVRKEDGMRESLKAGMTLREAYERYGIL